MVNDPAHPVGSYRKAPTLAELDAQLAARPLEEVIHRARFLHSEPGPMDSSDQAYAERIAKAVRRWLDVQSAAPIPMVLHCPACGTQHIDQATEDWPNPPHTSHKCVGPNGCGCIWRPADVPTTGVEAIETAGSSDNWPLIKEMSEREDELAPPMRDEGDLEAEPTLLPACNKAPVGWRCTRGMGHDGLCVRVVEGAPFQGGLVERQAVLNALTGGHSPESVISVSQACDIVRSVPYARG